MSEQLELPDKPETGICGECGAKMVEYKFGLNRGLVAFLRALAEAGQPVTLDKLALTNGQYGNHSLVRHWGLAEMLEPTNEIEARKGGKWRLTDEGVAFLRGQHSVPKNIYTLRGKMTKIGGAQVHIRDIDEGYMYRGDYRQQASEQLK
jgi:hypothetical protein